MHYSTLRPHPPEIRRCLSVVPPTNGMHSHLYCSPSFFAAADRTLSILARMSLLHGSQRPSKLVRRILLFSLRSNLPARQHFNRQRSHYQRSEEHTSELQSPCNL